MMEELKDARLAKECSPGVAIRREMRGVYANSESRFAKIQVVKTRSHG